MTCCTSAEVLLHYTGESKTYYVDLGEAIKGRTITSITSITSDDALLTISSTAILTVDTADYDQQGNAVTIEANTGVSFVLSNGTAGSDDDDYTAWLRIMFTTSAGTEVARLKVQVLMGLP